jgi:hypothetical protein
MKKKTDRPREPSAASLEEVPAVDFADYRPGRRNPFVARLKSEGVEVVHEGPSRASLGEIPELAPKTRGRANPYAKRLQAEGYELQIGRRRPASGTEVGPTTVKSVRLPPALWARLEQRATSEGIALHALIRTALVALLEGRPSGNAPGSVTREKRTKPLPRKRVSCAL